MNKYASVVIDVDSTLSRIEGIDWLARQCPPEVRARITQTTDAAMRGDIPLEAVYGERLAMVRPTRAQIAALAQAYIDGIAPGAKEAIRLLLDNKVRVILVSGGLRDAILPLGRYVGICEQDVHAVGLFYDENGVYQAYDKTSPLARRGGKPELLRTLALPAPIFAMGDGITDAEMKPVVDCFAAFVGAVRHERVVQAADIVLSSFTELPPLILPELS